uniref:Neurogenic mastermind-like N-terminal domain-containing protein n=1 Tax=Cyprinus carpio TaxID=7962 RepID=A0A8C2HTN6_CYPCA
MGEAAPTQATPSGFAPMLGVGMGGSVTPIATSRGSAVPQLHSAIVERLRARIELCRRHHSTCEDRYVRGQAETSDREHESTLHLLSIVHQGPGNRKNKANKSASQHHNNGGSQPLNHSKHPITPSAQGLRRKIEAQSPGYTSKQNGLSCGASGSDFKRLRMEPSSFRSGCCALASGQTQRLVGDATQSNILRRKDPFMMPHGISSDLFNITLRDMKKEPTEIQTCGQSSTDPATLTFDFKDEVSGQIDPELQDLFDELTKTVPSLNDLELEKMLKQDDDFGLDLGRPSSAGAAPPCIHLDKPIKTEYSPDFSQATGSSSQLRPASAGPSFSMANTSLSTSPITSGHHGQVSTGGPSRGLPAWPEMSHAEQLKQMAANQHQPNSMLHNHQQSQAGGVRNWSTALGVHQTPGSFSQETLPGNASLSQQRLNAQSTGQAKGMSNCFLKPNEFNPSHHMDTKVLGTKPLLHFSPKAPPSTMSQQLPIMAAPPNKTTMQQQPSTAGQTQQQRPPVLSSQQKNSGQDQNLQRPLVQPQLNIPDTVSAAEKLSTQDQFSRHLTRPPPDYKQPRNGVGPQQVRLSLLLVHFFLPHIFLPFASLLMCLDTDSLIRIGLQQNKPQFHGTNKQSATFQSSTQHVRTSLSQDSQLGQRLGDMITNTSRMDTALNWANSAKQSGAPTGLDVKRLPNTVMPQSDIHFPPRSICPPNQVAPHSSLLPINPAIRSSATRASQPRIPPLPGLTCLTQSSTEQQGCPTTFGELSQSPATYQNNQAGRLTFDFLPEDDNTVPGINADSDFIDSLLKSGSGNDDWMKDINLEEILGGHS